MIGGFLLLLFLERLSFSQTLLSPEHTIPYILATILIIHSLTEGAALGIGNTAEAVVIFIAIIAHKGSASFALCVTLMRYNLPFKQIIFIIIFFSLMTPLGIGLGALISTFTKSGGGEFTTAAFNAFAAGTFLYISTLHHIRFHQRLDDAQGLLEFAFLTIGLVAMGMIAVWA
jgi:zinc transporter 1/2/3